jgi:hypothetical protein
MSNNSDKKMLPDLALLRKFGAKETKDSVGVPLFKVGDIKTIKNIVEVKNGTLEKELEKETSKEIQAANDFLEFSLNKLNKKFQELKSLEIEFINHSKQSTGKLKDCSEKIGQAFERIHSKANFEKLEQYILLLERASKAMQSLSSVHDSGKLAKIMEALR